MFDQQKAEAHLNYLLKWYKIKVREWSVTSCGKAYYKTKEIKIPKPTNVDRFLVCLHEVKHIIDGNKGRSIDKEFACDMYAREEGIKMGFDVSQWDKRTNWHCLSRIAMAHNRGLKLSNISEKIKTWFKDVDFKEWQGKKVYVEHSKTDPKGYILKLTPTLSKAEIEHFLTSKGLILEKSESDDSTYGKWIVRTNGERFGSEFTNLTEIVSHYKLAV